MSRSVSVNCTSVDPSCYYRSILYHSSICILFLLSLHNISHSVQNEYDLKILIALSVASTPSHVMRRTQNSPKFKKRKKKKEKKEKKKRTSPATVLKNPPKQRSSWPGSNAFCLRDLQKTPLKNSGNYSCLSYALSPATDTLHWPYAFFSLFFPFFHLCALGPRRPPCCLPEAINRRTGVQIACDSVSLNNKHVYNAVSIHKKL